MISATTVLRKPCRRNGLLPSQRAMINNTRQLTGLSFLACVPILSTRFLQKCRHPPPCLWHEAECPKADAALRDR
eukprot:6526022-Pyramimonas_sp.AAC.1